MPRPRSTATMTMITGTTMLTDMTITTIHTTMDTCMDPAASTTTSASP